MFFFASHNRCIVAETIYFVKKMFSDEKAIWGNNVLKAAQNVIYLLINKIVCDWEHSREGVNKR